MRYFNLLIFLFGGISLLGQEKAQPVMAIEPIYQKEIRQLSKKKCVKKAFQIIEAHRSQTLADHILLTEIEAPPLVIDEEGEEGRQ